MTAAARRAGILISSSLLLTPAAAPQAAPDRPPVEQAPRDHTPGDQAPRTEAAGAEAPGSVQAVSLLGETLLPPPMADEDRAAAERALVEAQHAFANDTGSVDALVLLGRRFSSLGKYKEAVALYTQGLVQHPDEPQLLRHRGHRYITLRQFGAAVTDLQRAADLVRGQPDEPEPGLSPNARGIVLDTFHENIHYHLALAHYLQGELPEALAAWQDCGRCVTNDDGRAMVAHWTWLTLRQLGRDEEAAAAIAEITPELDIVEYHAYHHAVLVYRGLKDAEALMAGLQPAGDTAVDFASLGYGVARWHLAEGRREQGEALLGQVARTEMWAAFGRIAAEADLARARAAALPPEPVGPR
jgi:tetratricopeptide (TPR) repeat protein